MLTAIQGISMSHRDEAADNSDDDMQDVGVADANYWSECNQSKGEDAEKNLDRFGSF